jgi:hypothetical protein
LSSIVVVGSCASELLKVTLLFVVVDGVIVEHDTPLPVNPLRHVQVRDPGVLPQSALAWQPPLLVAHSFTSLHAAPLAVNPLLQLQLNEPAELLQMCAHPPLLVAHSSMSVQFSPLPVKPALQDGDQRASSCPRTTHYRVAVVVC